MIKFTGKLSCLILVFVFKFNVSCADFFKDISDQIKDNEQRLSYGVAVSDINNDGKYEFLVTGFGFKNLALAYKNRQLVNIADDKLFTDPKRQTIGVAACDVDRDGFEEIYFLNTAAYSG